MDDDTHGDNFTTCKECGAVIPAYKSFCKKCVLDLNRILHGSPVYWPTPQQNSPNDIPPSGGGEAR